MKVPGMRITCGIASTEGLESAARSGAQEVFCGYQDPSEPSAFLRILNRREMPSANLTTVASLDAVLKRAESLGLRVFVTLNEQYTAPQYDGVRRLLDLLSKRPVAGIIVSDFGLLLLLREEYGGQFVVHMGTGALSLNRSTARLYRDHGAKRIVLSRKIFTQEVASIVRALPDLETEAFMEYRGFCPNFDGLCNLLHNNAVCPSERCSVLEFDYPVAKEHDLVHCGCKVCAIWDYSRLGVTCLKIPSRDRAPEETFRWVGLIRELEAMVASTTKPEFVDRARTRMEQVLHVACPTPRGCFLAASF